jgi:hypothetical protein
MSFRRLSESSLDFLMLVSERPYLHSSFLREMKRLKTELNSLQKKGFVVLAILSLAVFVTMFTTMAHAAQVHVSQSSDPDAGTACSGTGSAQVGDCNTVDGSQSGDQSAPDTEPAVAED